MKLIQTLIIGSAFALSACGPTTYQRTVKAQADAPPPASTANAKLSCPSVAPEGSPAYLECERRLRESDQDQEQGIGGSGVSDAPPTSSCADPISAKDPKMMAICGLSGGRK